jgi:hypothetical protein
VLHYAAVLARQRMLGLGLLQLDEDDAPGGQGAGEPDDEAVFSLKDMDRALADARVRAQQ